MVVHGVNATKVGTSVTPEHGAMVLDGILRGEWPPSLALPPWRPTGPYFHGGFPGLEVGDLLLPGHRKPSAPPAAPLSSRVCVTTLEEHARTYAAWYFPEPHEPGGDLYEVEPVGLIARGRCDMPERWVCKTARVVRVVERGLVAR